MNTSITQILGLHYLTDDSGEIYHTPAGNPIGCCSEEVIKIVIEDISMFGADPRNVLSIYGLLCSYLDFRVMPRAELISHLILAMEDDIVYRELAMKVTMGDINIVDDVVLGSPYPEKFLRDAGFYSQFDVEMNEFSGMINYQNLADWLRSQLEPFTAHQLACLGYCTINLNGLLPTLALLSSDYSTEDFKELIEDVGGEDTTRLIDHLRHFAELSKDCQAATPIPTVSYTVTLPASDKNKKKVIQTFENHDFLMAREKAIQLALQGKKENDNYKGIKLTLNYREINHQGKVLKRNLEILTGAKMKTGKLFQRLAFEATILKKQNKEFNETLMIYEDEQYYLVSQNYISLFNFTSTSELNDD